ncbi:hypothetical protein D9M68_1001720 [compost metagenome]
MVLDQVFGGLHDFGVLAAQQRREDVFFFVQMVLARFTIEIVEHAARLLACGRIQPAGFDGIDQRVQLLYLRLDFAVGGIKEFEDSDGSGRGAHDELLING